MALAAQHQELVNASGGGADGTHTVTNADRCFRHQLGVNIGTSSTIKVQWRRSSGGTAHELDEVTASATIFLTGYFPILEVVVSGTTGAVVVDHAMGDSHPLRHG